MINYDKTTVEIPTPMLRELLDFMILKLMTTQSEMQELRTRLEVLETLEKKK